MVVVALLWDVHLSVLLLLLCSVTLGDIVTQSFKLFEFL